MQWVPLGDYIEQCDERNTNNQYTIDDVKGMTITKEVIPTKADLTGNDLAKFKIVKSEEFIYNPRTHGKKIGLGYNDTGKPFLISWNNIAFRIKNKELLPEYLFLYFNRNEWDREACFQSWGSSTEVFSWEALCVMRIPLPSIEEQKKVVEVWKGLKELKEDNENMAEPLLTLCQSYLKELKTKYPLEEIGKYISLYDRNNLEQKEYTVIGINKNKEFMPTVANIETIDKKKYKLVKKGIFVFSGMQTGRDECIRISLYNKNDYAIISPAYTTFTIDEEKGLLSEFLFLCFNRFEMDRYGWFISDSSVRSNLDWNRFLEIKIPIPPLEIQQAIVEIYKCAKESKEIAEKANGLISDICPALIRQVIGAAAE